MSLTKEQFLTAGLVLPRQEVEIKNLGKVWLRVMPASEKEAYEMQLMPGGKLTLTKGYQAKLIRRCVVDEQGAVMFAEADEAVIGSLNSTSIDDLYFKCMKLNGLMPGALEEAVKNSESGQVEGSPSGLPRTTAS